MDVPQGIHHEDEPDCGPAALTLRPGSAGRWLQRAAAGVGDGRGQVLRHRLLRRPAGKIEYD